MNRRVADSRSWPWLVAVAMVTLIVHLPYLVAGGASSRFPAGLPLQPDEGAVLYESHRIAHGDVMYRDFFEFQGPVFYYMNAIGLRMAGSGVAQARALQIVVSAVAAVLIALLVSRFLGRAAGIGAALVHACLLFPMFPHAYPHWVAELLALLALTALTADNAGPKHHLLAGCSLALAAFTIQSVGVPILVAAIALAALAPRGAGGLADAARRSAAVAAGAALSGAVILLYFVVHDAFDDLIYSMWIWPFRQYRKGQGDAVAYAAWVGTFIDMHARLPWHERIPAVLGLRGIQVLPVLATAAAVVALTRVRDLARLHKRQYDSLLVIGACFAAVAPLWTGLTRHDITHIAFLGGLCLVATAAGAFLIAERAPIAGRIVSLGILGAGALMLVSYGSKSVRAWHEPHERTWKAETLATLPNAAWLDANLDPADRIVSGYFPGLYYLYVRPGTISYTYLPRFGQGYFTDAQWQRVANEIADKRPRALFLNPGQAAQVFKRREELSQRYTRHGELYWDAGTAPPRSPFPSETDPKAASPPVK